MPEIRISQMEKLKNLMLKQPVGAAGSLPRDWVRKRLGLDRIPGGGTDVTDGAGVRIAHFDTGYADHPSISRQSYDLANGFNALEPGEQPIDLFVPGDALLPHPGHGTTASSIIVGSPAGTAEQIRLYGLAPAATIVPYRCIYSVVNIDDNHHLEQALQEAVRRADFDIMLFCLGGPGNQIVRDEIQKAVYQKNKIVITAAGNVLPCVWAPGKFVESITVAATDYWDARWEGSASGGAVNFSAPGEDVPFAYIDDSGVQRGVNAGGDGTTFAAASTAAVAAVWIAYCGKDKLNATYNNPAKPQDRVPLQAVFEYVVRTTARRPELVTKFVFRKRVRGVVDFGDPNAIDRRYYNLKTEMRWRSAAYGGGIISVPDLINAGLPEPAIVKRDSRIPTTPPSFARPSVTVDYEYAVMNALPQRMRSKTAKRVKHALRENPSFLKKHAEEIAAIAFSENTHTALRKRLIPLRRQKEADEESLAEQEYRLYVDIIKEQANSELRRDIETSLES